MSGRKLQIVVLAPILILATAHCLFACAAEICYKDKLPPCHRQHQQSKQGDAPPACNAPLLAEYRGPLHGETTLALAVAPAPTKLMDVVPLHNAVTGFPEDTSPPLSPETNLSTVLKI